MAVIANEAYLGRSPTRADPEESRRLVARLQATPLFRRFATSFAAASGLALTLRPLGTFRMPASGHEYENPFCALIATDRKGCLNCLRLQERAEREGESATTSVACPFGLTDSLVPVTIGTKLIGYLQTGQVALQALDESRLAQLACELEAQGIELPPEAAREAYSKSRQHSATTYEGHLSLLECFADTLAEKANELILMRESKRYHASVARGLQLIESHYSQPLSLDEVARAAGTSMRHFSRLFRQETGFTFLEFLTRRRIEHAKRKIRETRHRLSEIAFESGFESIAQFNRSFRRLAGSTPSDYRIRATS